jgi:hypothetical protein
MNMFTNWKTRIRPVGALFGFALLFALVPMAALAGQKSPPTCDALVSITNNLYLATPSGTVLTRFTSDGTAKDYATVAPDGKRVAYAKHRDQENEHYWVADTGGTQVQFPVYTAKAKADTDYDALGPLMGLRWSSNHVLRLVKHVSPTASRFEFHRIPGDLNGKARMIRAAAYGDGCVMRRHGGSIACVRGESVTIDGREVFHVSEFAGKAPMTSFTLNKGETKVTSGDPSFTVKVVGFYRGNIGLEVSLPNGNGGTTYLPSNKYIRMWWKGQSYGFSATLVDKTTGLVRIDVFKGNDVYHRTGFSPALAWLPHGRGLLLVHQTDTGPTLDLIRPGRRHERHGPPAKKHGFHWRLAAQVPISLPDRVRAMRFLTPSLLLLDVGGPRGPKYSKVAVHVSHKHEHKEATIKIGVVKEFPSAISVKTNGKSVQSPVLDWSCRGHRRGD